MKYSVVSLAFLSSMVAAQAINGVPKCAAPCIAKFTSGTEIAGCKQLDIKCICTNSSFLTQIACCLTTACDADGQAQAVSYAKQICASQGVSTPDKVVCDAAASSSLAASGSAAPSASAASGSAASASGSAASASASASASATESSSASKTSGAVASATTKASDAHGLAGSLAGAAAAVLFAL